MATRVNGYPQEGVWFSKDVRFLGVTVTGGAFDTDLSTKLVNSGLEMCLEAIATRGSLLGLNVTAATTFQVIVDYAQAYDDAAVVTEVEALIDAIAGLSAAAIVVNPSWVGAA